MQEDSRTVVMRVAALAGNRAARLLDVPKPEKHNKYSSGSLRSAGSCLCQKQQRRRPLWSDVKSTQRKTSQVRVK